MDFPSRKWWRSSISTEIWGKDGVINDASASNGEIHEYSVYDANQINYIGYDEDIEGFKQFVERSEEEVLKPNFRNWKKLMKYILHYFIR